MTDAGRQALLVLLLAACGDNLRGETISVSVDLTAPGVAIPEDFLGVSYETTTLVGSRYFRADNAALLATFRTLGLASLRLGGNEADIGPMPSSDDITAALQFAEAASVDVIYTLRLSTDDPVAGAAVAHTVMASPGADRIQCFSIGNEANWYLPSYADYATAANQYMAAIDDPRARYCGPDAGDHAWVANFARDFAPRGDIATANVHIYYGIGTEIAPRDARDKLLSSELTQTYQADHDDYVPRVLAAGAKLRVAEVNSFASGGCPGASDAFASALWGLDYLYWWASHDASGVNFHTGDHVWGASTSYALFTTSDAGYRMHPLSYAVKAFDLGRHGRLLPITIDNPTTANITAYGVLTTDGRLVITLVNKSHDTSAVSATMALDISGFAAGEIFRLEAGGHVAARDGVTLGGAAIAEDGSWAGQGEPATRDLELPAASAAVIVFHR